MLIVSAESFILCQDYSPPGDFVPTMIDFSLPNYGLLVGLIGANAERIIGITSNSLSNSEIIPFVACGDLSGLDDNKR